MIRYQRSFNGVVIVTRNCHKVVICKICVLTFELLLFSPFLFPPFSLSILFRLFMISLSYTQAVELPSVRPLRGRAACTWNVWKFSRISYQWGGSTFTLITAWFQLQSRCNQKETWLCLPFLSFILHDLNNFNDVMLLFIWKIIIKSRGSRILLSLNFRRCVFSSSSETLELFHFHRQFSLEARSSSVESALNGNGCLNMKFMDENCDREFSNQLFSPKFFCIFNENLDAWVSYSVNSHSFRVLKVFFFFIHFPASLPSFFSHFFSAADSSTDFSAH